MCEDLFSNFKKCFKDVDFKDLTSKDVVTKNLAFKDMGTKDLAFKDVDSMNFCKNLDQKELLGKFFQNEPYQNQTKCTYLLGIHFSKKHRKALLFLWVNSFSYVYSFKQIPSPFP